MKTALIIGGTSAVAAEFSRQLLSESYHIYLVARSADRCAAIAEQLGSACAGWWVSDCRDYLGVTQIWDEIVSQVDQIDTVLIAYGYLGDQLQSEADFEEARNTIEINFTSVVNWLIHLTEKGTGEKIRKIGVITSVAGDRGRPRNYTYGASKGALSLYLEGFRSRLWGNVEVYTFKLGPVDTPMTAAHQKNFSFTTKERAAALMIRALKKKKYVCYIPSYWRYVLLVVRIMPEWLFQKLKFLSGK